MSDCIHIKVCGKCYAKPKECGCYEQRREKCKWELTKSGTLYDIWRCSCCGYEFAEPRTSQGYTELEPNFCPNCGREVEK